MFGGSFGIKFSKDSYGGNGQNMETQLPVILWHCGCQEYLEYAVKQCRRYNDRVILLGNKENQRLGDCVEWYDQDQYLPVERWNRFLGMYKHMSTNDERFEVNCFKRFYAVLNFVRTHNVEKFMYLDSDILCFCNFSQLAALAGADVAMGIPQNQEPIRWIANCGISLWTADALEDFLCYLERTYSEDFSLLEKKWNYHCTNGVPGGICDMTLEYLWYVQDQKFRKLNLVDIEAVKDGVFDVKVISPENYLPLEFQMDQNLGIKKIIIEDGLAYFIRPGGEKVKALGIHFLGGSKLYLPIYARQEPIPFKLRIRAVYWNIRNTVVGRKNAMLRKMKYALNHTDTN